MFDPYYKWLGIPPKDQPPNLYRLLGIDLFEADLEVIDTAANKQMAHLQSCATGPHVAASQKLLNEIASARLCLLAPAKKTKYDKELNSKIDSSSQDEQSKISGHIDQEFGTVTKRREYSPSRTRTPAKSNRLPLVIGGAIVVAGLLVVVVLSSLGKKKERVEPNPLAGTHNAGSDGKRPLSVETDGGKVKEDPKSSDKIEITPPKTFVPVVRARTFRVNVETTHGSFAIQLHDQAAPKTVDGFLSLVQSKSFDGSRLNWLSLANRLSIDKDKRADDIPMAANIRLTPKSPLRWLDEIPSDTFARRGDLCIQQRDGDKEARIVVTQVLGSIPGRFPFGRVVKGWEFVDKLCDGFWIKKGAGREPKLFLMDTEVKIVTVNELSIKE